MSATPVNLSFLAYAQGFSLIYYRGDNNLNPSSLEEMLGDDFFTPLSDLLSDRDLIVLGSKDGVAFRVIRNAEGRVSLEKVL